MECQSIAQLVSSSVALPAQLVTFSDHDKMIELQGQHRGCHNTVAADLMETPRDFNDVNGSMIRKLNSDLFIILNF